MDLSQLERDLFEKTLKQFFAKMNLSFDVSRVVEKIKQGQELSAILQQQSQNLTARTFCSLDQTLESTDFKNILKDREEIRNLMGSQHFLTLQKIFLPTKKNVQLLKFLIKQSLNQQCQEALNQYKSSINPSQLKIFQNILETDQFRMWSGRTSHKIQQTHQQNKCSDQTKELINQIKAKLQELLNFKADMSNIVQIIIRGESEQDQLVRLQEQMKMSQYRKMLQIFKSFQMQKIKEKIKQIHQYSRLKQELRTRILSSLKEIKFDPTKLVNAIVDGLQYESILCELQNNLVAKQHKKLLQIIYSSEISSLKQVLNLHKVALRQQQNKIFSQLDECRFLLTRLFSSIQYDTSQLINTILQRRSQTKILLKFKQTMTQNSYNQLQLIMRSESFLKIQQNIRRMVPSEDQKQRAQLIEAFRPFKIDVNILVDLIMEGNSLADFIYSVEEILTARQCKQLISVIQSQKVARVISRKNKIQQQCNTPVKQYVKLPMKDQSHPKQILTINKQDLMNQLASNPHKMAQYIQAQDQDENFQIKEDQIPRNQEFNLDGLDLIILQYVQIQQHQIQLRKGSIQYQKAQMQKRNKLKEIFKIFPIDLTILIERIITNKFDLGSVINQLSQKMNKQHFLLLSGLVNLIQNPLQDVIEEQKKNPQQEQLANFFKNIQTNTWYIQRYILANDHQQQKRQKREIYKQISQQIHQKLQMLMLSWQFVMFRCEKLKNFENILPLQQSKEFYVKFQKILRIVSHNLRYYQINDFNIYILVIRLLKKEQIDKIRQDQEQILPLQQFQHLSSILKSKELYIILEDISEDKDQNEVEIDYLFRELRGSQKIKLIILQGRSDEQLNDEITILRRTKPAAFIKILNQLIQTQTLKDFRIKLIKKSKISQIFTDPKDEIIVNKLSMLTSQNLKEVLKEIKVKIGLQQFEAKAGKIFCREVEDIIGVKLIVNENVRTILNYLHLKNIFVGYIKLIPYILAQKDIQKVLQKCKSKFSINTYSRLKEQFKNKDFLNFLYRIKYSEFDQYTTQLRQIFSFLKYCERFTQQLVHQIEFEQRLEEVLKLQEIQSLDKLYPTINSSQCKEILEKIDKNIPVFQQRYVVNKSQRRFIFKKGTKIESLKFDKDINYSKDQLFVNKECDILSDDYQLCEHIQCIKGTQFDLYFLQKETSIILPGKQTIQQLKNFLRKKYSIKNQICIQIKKDNQFINVQDECLLKKINTNSLYLSYYINLIIKIQLIQQQVTIKVLSNQTISSIQQRTQDKINMKKQSQKWYLDGQQILNKQHTFQSLRIRKEHVRIKIIQDRTLQYYGFDKIIQIQRNQFKSFYIEDDDQTKEFIKNSDFPAYDWSEAFRKICLGYIFSGMKKHSRISSCLNHLQNLIAESGKDQNLWKPKTLEQKCYFNETYVIHNIIKSSKVQLRTDIFKCLMINYPIPLAVHQQNGEIMPLFEQNYWITSKAFTIVSFGLSKLHQGKRKQINGKSTLLNIVFETDFQDKANLHRQCQGGINIQYNIYQNDQYYVNLVDISNKIQESLILRLIHSSNMIVIHITKEQEAFVDQWIEQNLIELPVIIFTRDSQDIFRPSNRDERKKQKESNQNNSSVKKYSLVQITSKSLSFYNQQFNQISNSVQQFVRSVYLNQKQQNLWNFSDFLGQCNPSYLQFNKTLKKMLKSQQDLSRITNYFYDWKSLSYNKDRKAEKESNTKMEKIKGKATKQGIPQLIKEILVFYQNNSSRATQIMSKLRMFLTLVRNELFRDFNELYRILKVIHQYNKESAFKQIKENIINLLKSINGLKKNLSTPKLKKSIEQFMNVQRDYNTSSNIDERWKRIFKSITEQFENHIQPKTLSIQNFWRQVVYMCKFDPYYQFTHNKQKYPLYENIVSLSKKQINQSQNFQIINGDLLEMPSEFLKKIFENQEGKKIMIVAIFGPQSSGKSTLLNFVLGCDFMSSAGRCTKGIYGTYFEISNKQIPNCQAILVLDTQGLFSNYKNEKFQNRNGFDNKLVLFCLQVCDLIIMNTKGDMTIQCQQILANAFDSQTLDSKNLPAVYFVLNFNGGKANVTQIKEIEKACVQINTLNPATKAVVNASNSKGMPMAFNEVARKTNATQISKYLLTKNTPSDLFYKETNSLSRQIFKLLEERGKTREKTLAQAFDNMSATWATINRFQILTAHSSRHIKDLQQKIQKWTKTQYRILQQSSLESKHSLGTINYQNLHQWEKQQFSKYQKMIVKMRQNFEAQFPRKQGDDAKAYNKFIENSADNLDTLFNPITEDLKRTIMERKYRLQMELSHQNGLDDIIALVKQVKSEQLSKGVEITEKDKKNRFQKLWSKRISEMRESLNRKKMAQQHYHFLQKCYNDALKASNPNRNIYQVDKTKGSLQLHQKDVKVLDNYLRSQIKKKYRQQAVFQPSNQKPVMNISKSTGDLSFKYLDMSKYFENKQQKVYISISSTDLFDSISFDAISRNVKERINKSDKGKSIAQLICKDFQNLLGIQLKKSRIEQWLRYYLTKSWWKNCLNFFVRPKQIILPADSLNMGQFNKKINKKSQSFEDFQQISKIENSKQYFMDLSSNSNEKQFFFENFCLFGLPGYRQDIRDILAKQKCLNSLDGNIAIISKILKKVLERLSKSNGQVMQVQQQDMEKVQIEHQISLSILKDIEKINITVENSHQLVGKIDNQQKITCQIFDDNLLQFSSLSEVKKIIQTFSDFWQKQKLLKSLFKGNKIEKENILTFGYINQLHIIVKEEYHSQKILSTYIGKEYQQFLNEIHKSNFKQFIQKELKYQTSFQQIYCFIFDNKLCESDLTSSVNNLKNKVNQIVQLINKDLQQVSQKLRFDFVIDIHSYAFHILWFTTFNETWSNRQSLIKQFNDKKSDQYQRFLALSSGKADQQNKATSKTFIEEYIRFLNAKITEQKRQKSLTLAKKYNNKYTRQRIQEQVQLRVQKQTNKQVLLGFVLEPEAYIEKVLRDEVRKSYLIELQKYSNVDYKLIIKQLMLIVTQLQTILPQVEKCSIEEVFDINILNQNKNKAFIRLFCQVILKRGKSYVSSKEKLGEFKLKPGQKFKYDKSCKYQENTDFLNSIETKQIHITNIKMFCESLSKDLKKINQKNDLKIQISAQDKTEALKNLKIQICKHKCPLCKKSCDIDMISSPHHSIHKCNFGHQIRAFGGMVIEQTIKDKTIYKSSILRCDDLTPDSQFQFNGRNFKWSQFKLQKKDQWDFQVSPKYQNAKSFYMKLWKKVANYVCEYYSKSQNKTIQVVEYSDQAIKSQTAIFQTVSPAHYIFAIDQSGSMHGQRWVKALESLKDTIQTISNKNTSNNLFISLFKFNQRVTRVFNTISPVDFNKNTVTFSGGNTAFSPVFQTALQLIKVNLDKDNVFIFISDGQAPYPEAQIKEFTQIIQQQKLRGFKVGYTSIMIGNPDSQAPIMERITKQLNGQHQLVIDAKQISSLIKEIHFRGK